MRVGKQPEPAEPLKVSDIRKIITDYHNEIGAGRKLVANETDSNILKKLDIGHSSSSPEMATLESIFPSDEVRATKALDAYDDSSNAELCLLKDEKQKKNMDEQSFASKKKEIIKKAIKNADEKPISGENLLKLTDLLLSDSITKLLDSKSSSKAKQAFQKLRDQFEWGPAKLEDYKKLRQYRFYNKTMVDYIHDTSNKQTLERYLTTLELLNKKNIYVSEKKPENYPTDMSAAETLMLHLHENPDMGQAIKLLDEKKLLTTSIFWNIFLERKYYPVRVDTLIKCNEDKKYEAIRSPDLNLMLSKKLIYPEETLDFCLELNDAKILTNENKVLVFNAISETNFRGWGNNPVNPLIEYLLFLKNKNILDSKNIGIFCQSFIYQNLNFSFKMEYVLQKITEDVFQKKADVAQQKKELERVCDLFVMNREKTTKISLIAYHFQTYINASIQDLISLFKEDAKTIDALYVLSMKNILVFNQPDAFELIKCNPHAITESIRNFNAYIDKNEINIKKFILTYPEYTRLDGFKEIITLMDQVGILTMDNVHIICNMPYPKATVQALLGLLSNDMRSLRNSELIQIYEAGENGEYNKKTVANFGMKILTTVDISRPEFEPRIIGNQIVFDDFISFLEKASQLKAKATDDVLVSLFRVPSIDPKVQVTSSYYSSRKTAAVMLDEKIDFALDSFKDSLKTEKEKKQNAGTNLSALQTKLVDRMTELQENLSKIQQQEKSAINMVEEKIPQVRTCIKTMLREVISCIDAYPPGTDNELIRESRRYSDILLTRADEVDKLEDFVEQEKEEKNIPKKINEQGRLAIAKQTEREKKYVQDLKGLADPAVTASAALSAMFSGSAAAPAVPSKVESIEDKMNEEISKFKKILNSKPDVKVEIQDGEKATTQSKEENVEFKIHSILNEMDDEFRNISSKQSDSERLLDKMEIINKKVGKVVCEIDRVKRLARYTPASTTSSGGQFPDLLKRCQVYGQVIQNRIKTPLEAWLKINRVAQQKHGQVVKPKNFGDHKF